MAWFKLNDSLNTLKDQLSSVSSVVQEAFQEPPPDADDDAAVGDVFRRLETEKQRSDELSALCGSQLDEISTLRRQIHEMQLAQKQPPAAAATAATSTSSLATKSRETDSHGTPTAPAQTGTTTLEDSWFWESEPATTATTSSVASSAASHRDDATNAASHPGSALNPGEHRSTKRGGAVPKSSTTTAASAAAIAAAGDDQMKTIPLDFDDNDTADQTVVRRADELRRARIENAILNEKLVQLQAELRDGADSLERLDSEHSAAIDELLHMKESLQRKCTAAELSAAEMRAVAERQANEMTALTAGSSGRVGLLEQELAESRAETAAAQAQLDAVVQAQSEASVQLAQVTSEAEVLRKRAELERRKDEQQIEEMLELRRQQEEIIERLRADVKAAYLQQREAEDKLEERNRLEADVLKSEIEQLKRQLTAANAQAESNEETANLRAELNQLNSELNALRENDHHKVQPDSSSASLAAHASAEPSISLFQLAEILRPFAPIVTDIDAPTADTEEADTVDGEPPLLSHLRNTLASIDQLKFDLESLAEKNHQLGETNARIQHAKDTAQADVHHYEVELAEVMKNNELLLAELDAARTAGAAATKLETISEQNEDNIVILEQQLEDCSNLNQSLEDEYQEMRDRLQASDRRCRELEAELREQSERGAEMALLADGAEAALRAAHDEWQTAAVEQSAQLAALRTQVETVDGERSTLAFELAELRAAAAETSRRSSNAGAELDELRLQVASLNERLASGEKQRVDIEQRAQSTASDLSAQVADLQRLLDKKTADVTELIAQLHAQAASADEHERTVQQQQQLTAQLDAFAAEKAELMALCTAKHAESLQYHEECQRLGALLHDAQTRECTRCAATAPQLTATIARAEAAAEQVGHVRAECDRLTQALLAEQETAHSARQLVEQQRAERAELLADVQRLRAHLLEVEESHTQEAMAAQQANDMLQVRLAGLEQDAKKSSTAFTSASIRANQHTETLQAQYALLVQQRDEFSAKLSAAEDKESRSEAALINLQCALEQFQNNKERDIAERTQHMERQLDAAAAAQQQLRTELGAQQLQLAESKNGLLAAARITDQLESAQLANTNLRDELHVLRQQQAAVEQQLAATRAAHGEHVEKGLLKNLLIGYVAAPNAGDKQQVLKLIASVLDFDAHDSERAGLGARSGGGGGPLGWIGAIRNAALVVGQSTSAGPDSYNKEGLAQAFVRFLENESKPKQPSTAPSLLNIVPTPNAPQQQQPPSALPSTSATASEFPAGLQSAPVAGAAAPSVESTAAEAPQTVQPIVINDSMLQSFAPARNTSTILKDILNDS